MARLEAPIGLLVPLETERFRGLRLPAVGHVGEVGYAVDDPVAVSERRGQLALARLERGAAIVRINELNHVRGRRQQIAKVS